MNLRALMLGTAMALTLVLSARAQTASINGHWEGNMFAHGASLPVSFDLAQSPHGLEGRFTSPTQAAMDYPLPRGNPDILRQSQRFLLTRLRGLGQKRRLAVC